jgi:simple sugar transport system ATP-binding protein
VAEAATAADGAPAPRGAAGEVLRVEGIAKSFGPIIALRDMNLRLAKGEVLGLVGDNGSGKSTMMKILCGFQKQDRGSMFLRGDPYAPRSVDEARTLGIDAVYQDLALVDELAVFQNLFLHREHHFPGLPLIDNRKMRKEAREALDEIGINIPDLNAPVARLSGGQRQAIAVARAIHDRADIILLDEPLAAMGAKEGALILDLIQRIKGEGEISMIIVAHNYVQVLEICDRVNLIQDGEIRFDKPSAETSLEELNEIVVEQYRRARAEAMADQATPARADQAGQ